MMMVSDFQPFMINVELETSVIPKFITSVTHVTPETTHFLRRHARGDHRQLFCGRGAWQGSTMRAFSRAACLYVTSVMKLKP